MNYERICIFAAYDTALSISTLKYLEFIKGLGFGIIYVNNASMDADALEQLRSLCQLVFERKNLGRDIGAYRDAFLFARCNGLLEKAEYLLFANDSLAFIPGKNADTARNEILHAISHGYDGIYSHRNYSPLSHYQSFFALISKKIFNSSRNINFWKGYIPLSDRRHSIVNGEVRWSTKVLNAFSRNSIVLYSPNRFMANVGSRTLPKGIGPILNIMPSVSSTVAIRPRSGSDDSMAYGVLFDRKGSKMDVSEYLAQIDAISLAKICEILENTNQTHSAAFLYPLVLCCPFVKMDLCTAGSFTISTASSVYRALLLASLDARHDQNLIEDLSEYFYLKLDSKGIPSSYIGDSRKAYLLGIGNGFIYPTSISGWR